MCPTGPDDGTAMRVLHCPADVGGNAWTLSRAERKLGLHSDVMVFQRTWLGYPADMDLELAGHQRAHSAMRLLTFFMKALRRYDVFHFNFGCSFVPYGGCPGFLELSDLPILRGLGKKIVVTYQGSDARQEGFCRDNFAISPFSGMNSFGNRSIKADAAKRRRAGRFARYAHRMFALNPDLLYVLPRQAEFLPYASVDLNEWQPVTRGEDRNLVILHSPTNRGLKGTKHIIEAVDGLRDRYRHVELVLVENTPHSRVRELYRQADLAVDQLLIGWYGAFAVEMMALGKPVVCYIREDDLRFIPVAMREDLPILNATPDTIFEVLSQLVEQRDQLHLIGERSRAYVERWHDPIKVAMKTKEAYESIR